MAKNTSDDEDDRWQADHDAEAAREEYDGWDEQAQYEAWEAGE